MPISNDIVQRQTIETFFIRMPRSRLVSVNGRVSLVYFNRIGNGCVKEILV